MSRKRKPAHRARAVNAARVRATNRVERKGAARAAKRKAAREQEQALAAFHATLRPIRASQKSDLN